MLPDLRGIIVSHAFFVRRKALSRLVAMNARHKSRLKRLQWAATLFGGIVDKQVERFAHNVELFEQALDLLRLRQVCDEGHGLASFGAHQLGGFLNGLLGPAAQEHAHPFGAQTQANATSDAAAAARHERALAFEVGVAGSLRGANDVGQCALSYGKPEIEMPASLQYHTGNREPASQKPLSSPVALNNSQCAKSTGPAASGTTVTVVVLPYCGS